MSILSNKKPKFHLQFVLIILLLILFISNLYVQNVNGYTTDTSSHYNTFVTGEGDVFPVYVFGTNYFTFQNISDGVSVDTYGYLTRSSFLNFSNIVAYNSTDIIEDDPTTYTQVLTYENLMSFTVNMTCNLTWISFRAKLKASDSYLDVILYNASWDGSKPVYDMPWDLDGYLKRITISSDFDGWYNLSVNWYLDTSKTDNNTFFISLRAGNGNSEWYFVFDSGSGSDNEDEGYAYIKTVGLQSRDYELKVSVVPLNKTPSPSDINLRVNGTAVNDTSYGGSWKYKTPINGNLYFNITANWTITFDLNITLSEYKEEQTQSVTYTAYSNNTLPLWNVTVNATPPSTFTHINSTFTKPPDWTLSTVYVNGTATSSYSTNGNNITLEGSGFWIVLFNSPNYLAEPQNSITTYNKHSTNLTFVFSQSISSQNNGTAKISVYNTTGDSIANFTTVPTNNGTHDLVTSTWTPDSSLSSGTYNATALWCNGTEVGYRVRQVILLHPAHITSSYIDTPHLIGDNVTIVINYIRNDTGDGITGATVTGSWVYQSGIIFSDDGNGQYSADVPTYSNYKNGTYQFTITATKPGYQDQTYVVNITLIYKTDLVGSTSYSVQYEDTVTISVTYKFEHNDTAIPGATVYFDFQNGTVVEMKDYDNDGTYTLDVSSNVTAGTYNFVITASKQGYQMKTLSGTLTVYNVSTKLTTVNETTEYSIYYNVKSNITFYYNDSGGQGISGATTSYTSTYKNGSLVELGNGYYALQIAIKDVDTINFTITVEKTNYQSQTIVITITVSPRPTEVELLYNDAYTAGDSFNITITYKDTLSSDYIPNATVSILSNASNFQIFNLNNGTYKIQLTYNTYTAFNESLFVNVTSEGFSLNRSTILYKINLKSLTSPTYRYDSLIPFAENETIFVHYGVNGTPVIELNVSFDYTLISYNNGSYSVILRTDKSYPGTYSVELKIQIINYESFVIQFSFEIEGIPAHTEVVGNPENYWGGEIVLSVYFYDDYNGTYLAHWNLSITGISSTVYSTVWLGTHYNITIYTNKLNATVYPITITAIKLYYNQSFYDVSINILKSSFAPDYPQNVSQYENETLTISLTLYDYHFENPVSGANVTLILNGIEYRAQNPVDGVYVLNISLLGFTPGNYSASLIITKLNYEQYQTDIAVRVLKKYDVVLKLILPEKFVAGAENTISAKLTYTNGTPISYEKINFDISIELENNSVIEYQVFDDTDTDGIATVVIQLPYETKVVSVTAHYPGRVSLKSVTNSGSATAEPALTVNTVLFGPLSPYFFGTLIVALAAVVAIKQIQARKRRALEEYKLTISYYEDLLKIRHFLIIHKGSGVSMFYKAYGTDPFEPDLISGFITALSQFGTEIVETTSETVELKQKGLYIFATDTKYMRFAIMSSEELSSTFKKILTDAIKSLGEKYDPMVANWRGDLRASKEIGLALENKLALSFFYVPVAIKTTQNLKGKELVVVDKIQKLLKKLPNVNLKQIIDMLGHEDLPVIISLVKRQVIGTASKKLNHNRPDVSENSSEENNKKAD